MPALRDYFENPARGDGPPAAPDERAAAFHRSLPDYRPTPLVDAPRTARALGLGRLSVKMETERLGLPSFKILGASWATCRALSALAGRDEPAGRFEELREIAVAIVPLTLVAATDGNHGRAVARVARWLGLDATILVPEDMVAARQQAIRDEGAHVQVIRGTYDEAVAASGRLADERHLVISDTSWPGYADVPAWVADGYGTMFVELASQLEGDPRMVVVQIGVGALASATVRALARPGRVILGVEPDDAACVLAALRDGSEATAPGPHRSVMVGLNCGVASPIALPVLRAGLDVACSVDDSAAMAAVRLLLGDGLECGETGAAGVAGLVALHARWGADAWPRVAGQARPDVLAICTEAPTDPVSFALAVAG